MPGSYVRPTCDIIAGPPFVHTGTTLHAFVVPGSQAAQQSLLDTTVNQVGPSFTAEADAVLFTALYVENASSAEQGYTGHSAPETDIALWILNKDEQNVRRWFPVVMFVDRPAALLIGREVYGYPKQLASIERQTQDYDTDFRVRVSADTFIPNNTQMKNLPLIEVTTASFSLDQPPVGDITSVGKDQFEDQLSKAFFKGQPGFIGSLSTPYPGMPMLFLKQFRDIADPIGVCYQAVTEVLVIQDKLVDYALVNDNFSLLLHDTAVHRIANALGLSGKNQIAGAFRVRQDFTVPAGSEIYRNITSNA